VKRTSASCGPLLCTITWNPSAGTALFSTTVLSWHATVIDPPAFEKVAVADPGVTDAAGCVVVVAPGPGGGLTVEVTGAVVVVVVTAAGAWGADGNVVVVLADAAWTRVPEVDDFVGGALGCVGDDGMDVAGTLQVVMAWRTRPDEVAALAMAGAGMTGSGGEAITLVTAPTPTQLTAVAAVVAMIHAAIGSGLTRRILRFSSPQRQIRTKATIIPSAPSQGPFLSSLRIR
jgi:hypothetical protein